MSTAPRDTNRATRSAEGNVPIRYPTRTPSSTSPTSDTHRRLRQRVVERSGKRGTKETKRPFLGKRACLTEHDRHGGIPHLHASEKIGDPPRIGAFDLEQLRVSVFDDNSGSIQR